MFLSSVTYSSILWLLLVDSITLELLHLKAAQKERERERGGGRGRERGRERECVCV